jgi:NitT/TauT family transport system ATP-binding protein
MSCRHEMALGSDSRAIEILSACKTYPNGTHALQPINFSIREGEFLTLLGPSGCGKSTLLKIIAGLLKPTGGRILIYGKPVESILATGHKMSFVFQEATLMPWANVKANVRLPLDLQNEPTTNSDAKVAEVLKLVGLENFGASLPRELSGGMQMRVSIARGLVTEPSVLLMDEPFGALDEITRNRLDADLLELWQKKKLTVVFVTHSIYEAVYLSNRVVVMAARPGRVIDEVKIEEPYPRGNDFRVSTQFSQYAKRLQDSLLKASAL